MKERKLTKREIHEQDRKELWTKVAVAVAAASNSTTRYMMEKWADHAVAEFDKRFGMDAGK